VAPQALFVIATSLEESGFAARTTPRRLRASARIFLNLVSRGDRRGRKGEAAGGGGVFLS
jgi:hypothetical protein